MMEEILAPLYKEKWPVADAIDTLHRFKEEASEWGQSPWQYALERINAPERLKEYILRDREAENKTGKICSSKRDRTKQLLLL